MKSVKPELRIIGKIVSAHGIKGELRVYPLLDHIPEFETFKSLYINESEFKIQGFRSSKQFVILKLKGLNDRNSAESLSGYIYAEVNEELDENEFFINDLHDLKVVDENDLVLGKVESVSELGQTKLFIKLLESFNKKNLLIIPFVEKFIDTVDIKAGFIKIKESEFLLSLNS